MFHSIAQAATEAPLAERLLVAVAGPLISTVIGTGLIGWILFKLSSTAQARRTESEIRRELLATVTKTASGLYLATQNFVRVREDPELPEDVKRDVRQALDAQYRESRVEASRIEPELRALFGDPLADEWHKVDDLLTVRYMQLIGRATANLYQLNAKGFEGRAHSGLSAGELALVPSLLKAYHAALAAVTRGLLASKFKPDLAHP